MRAIDLSSGTRDLLAPVCGGCTWWLTAPGAGGGTQTRLDWEREAEAEAGFFGRALLEDDAVIGWMHAAAARLVRRAHSLPAGPPSQDAYVLACAYFYDEDYLRGFQFLLQELEAFGLRRKGQAYPFRGYIRELNLFHPEVLEGSGFRQVQTKGEVARYRLDLSTLVASARRSVAWDEVEAGAAAQPV